MSSHSLLPFKRRAPCRNAAFLFPISTPRLFNTFIRITSCSLFQRFRSCNIKMTADYTLYYTHTPNGKKVTLALEELGLSYQLKNIDIWKGDQFTPEFLALNPNNKTPTLVDHTAEGGDFVVFESGAILEYLAEKTGKLMPPMSDVRKRTTVKQWLYWQMSGFGPMLGQLVYFYAYSKDDVPVAKERFLKEAVRLFGVLDRQLEANQYIAGDEYSIADIACYWWSLGILEKTRLKEHFESFKNVQRWQKLIGERDAVARVNAIPL